MKTVTLDKAELLAILKENRSNHRAIFESALEGYRRKWIEVLEARLNDVRAGKQIEQNLWLKEPMDQTQDYDRAVRMVEMHVGETVELDEKRFANYVMDDWDWSQNFHASNSAYTEIH